METATRLLLIGGVMQLRLGAHSATAYWDQTYAEPRRPVTPVEQHLHSLLEVVPLMATGFLTAPHWDQARALFGKDKRRFALRPKRHDPLSKGTKAGLIAALAVFGALPYGEELWRCRRARPTLAPCRSRRSPPPRHFAERTARARHVSRPPIRPVVWRPPRRTRRTRYDAFPPARLIPLPAAGPEDVVVDGKGRLLTGVADGRLYLGSLVASAIAVPA